MQLLKAFFCNPTNEDEITRIIDSLDHHKAEDIYQFPIKVIKDKNKTNKSPTCGYF